jgi:hypothetical protein
MDKNRSELINLNTPSVLADKFEEMLKDSLAKAAKLKRVDENEKTNFSFYPTKSEYFLISVRLSCMADEVGAVRK